ncbi:MAG: sensor histidine kinase, partial [Polyangiaceae bacterium]|nr:sensor histidine kinase [Polyangiaceae bacterium]
MSPTDRLTRQELSWLLTQEARAAAQTLRKGVAELQKTPCESKIRITTSPAEIESSLDALDDAMQTLASLNVTMGPRGVRGRVDIAALVCEVAPSARAHLAPGSGTEVFGDESDLRRMIQVLVSQP